MIKNKPSVAKKVKQAPKLIKSGVAQTQNSSLNNLKKAKANLARTGSIKDAAAAWEQYL